jgi:hypothetical protein
MEGNYILKLNLVLIICFINVICYVRSISTNEAMYVMVAFEYGSNY